MAEKFIFSIAGQLLGQLSSPVFQELSLAWGVSDDLRRLENTVSYVRAVLLDAEERQKSSHQLNIWIEKLEDALYRAQDVLEEFEIDALRYKVCDRTILRKVRRGFSRSNRIVFRFKIAHKIKNIREEFDEIGADRKKFNLIERLDERVVVYREITHSFVRDEDVIGRDEEREAVISFLMATNDDEDDEILSVLPIIGLGGMGKTTLAKLVYNDERVVAHFDLRIWVCIPEEFELGKVVKEILKSAGILNCDDLPLEQLQKYLREKLESCKYLLIIDDVWNENRTKWIELRNLLIGGFNGSKIIITTRNKSVASIMATSDLNIEIKGLSDEECLSLFLKWAFRSVQDAIRYPHLVEIARSIVKKCKGVPLAVRTLGSIVYTKTDTHEWTNVRDNEIWKIEPKEGDIMSALKLSYYQLPSNLRRCFAFCSIFPKDHQFVTGDLIMCWQANGLLQRVGDDQDMEDVGLMYIKQLSSRGFFLEFQEIGSLQIIKMHDLVHDLSLLVAGRDCFGTGVVRHMSFPMDYFREKEIPSWLLEQNENVRTLIFPDGVGASKVSFVETCISKFRSLRLLHLNKSRFEVLPSSIGNMKHLKAIDLSENILLKELPTSICELVGLEYLDFQGCLNMEKLPRGIRKLIRLRYLGISTKDTYFPENELRCLTSLRVLSIGNCPNLKFVMFDDDICCLSALRTFTIYRCESLLSLPVRGLSRLTQLENLLINVCGHLNFTLDNNNNNNNNNNNFEIGETKNGRGEEGFCSLQSLSVAGLPELESLPLCLLNNGANNLKFISIAECENLTNLMPEAMLVSLKSLETLWIDNCPKLNSLPEGILCLTDLHQVRIWECPELVSRCEMEIGEDWHKICHIPNIYLDNENKPSLKVNRDAIVNRIIANRVQFSVTRHKFLKTMLSNRLSEGDFVQDISLYDIVTPLLVEP